MQTLTVEDLNQRLQQGDAITLIDVREPVETASGCLPDAMLAPLATLPARLAELQPDQTVVVYCHHGARSAQAVQFLEAAGFSDVANLTGGIDAWSRKIDNSIPLY